MFSLLTLVAFGIIGTLLVAVQYYILQGHLSNVARLWSKGWLIFLLFATVIVNGNLHLLSQRLFVKLICILVSLSHSFIVLQLAVYLVNVYMIAKSHLTPWYR